MLESAVGVLNGLMEDGGDLKGGGAEEGVCGRCGAGLGGGNGGIPGAGGGRPVGAVEGTAW